jgi:hypothetical protein
MKTALSKLANKARTRLKLQREIDPSNLVIAGRGDGFAMMLCNLLYWSAIARQSHRKMLGYWPETIPHLSTGERTGIDQILDPTTLAFTVSRETSVLHNVNHECSTDDLVNSFEILRSEFARVRELPEITSAVQRLPLFDFGIHARLGDVKENPLLYGGEESRYYPRSAYEQVIQNIIARDNRASIFLASNCKHMLNIAKEYPDNIVTEHDLVLAHGEGIYSSSLLNLWYIIRQLSKSKYIVSPKHSALSLLARVTADQPCLHSTPGQYLGIERIASEWHEDYSSQARKLFLCPSLDMNERWIYLLLKGWRSIPIRIRLEIATKILFAW